MPVSATRADITVLRRVRVRGAGGGARVGVSPEEAPRMNGVPGRGREHAPF